MPPFESSCSGASSGAGGAGILGLGLAALGVWAAGAAIKLVDAAVDGEPGWDSAACASYAAVLVGLGAAACPAWAISLVGGAWAVGMASRHRPRDLLESVAVLAAVALGVGWRESLGSLLAVAAVQVADRWVDREGWAASRGAAGRAALALVAAGLLLTAAALDPLKAGAVFGLTPAAEAGAALLGRVTRGEGERPVWSS